ncbi:uncharacterized protein B0J16DRAFT_348042 [Fusarium flagelliforme]|uniref:ribonuclease H n=1 Tax=Fusarium flagelliforme TaxID=2675880 RepID=A0A395MVW7_9HYPO|nr:uncharacterized protein B0J16DRAFT_348042 [Fusarium flagelliforme]KAH7180007.1 hypothetical protein B0J16DRAFT_348042 [Fusarium flagelliforme]RFN51897.1 rnase h domain protein [Fusarium flagelliforme]
MEAHNLFMQYNRIDRQLHDPLQNKKHVLEELLFQLNRHPDDPLRLSDIIPHVLLELGREQECYDFVCGSCRNTPISRHQVQGNDACEELSVFMEADLSLGHLVALTLLKLQLYLDFDAISLDLDRLGVGRPLGQIAKTIFERNYDHGQLLRIARDLHNQYLKLVEYVQTLNSYLWEALATQDVAYTSPPVTRGPGSRDEANLVLHHCKNVWVKSDGALAMLEADTAKYIQVYESPAMNNNSEPLERRRGTGWAFPVAVAHIGHSNTNVVVTAPFDAEKRRHVLGDKNRLLLYVDGTCTDNGRGGWAVSLGCHPDLPNSVIYGRLKTLGPFGHSKPATTNRAHLRAVIAALRLSNWKEEGFDSITIATSSTYVVSKATTRLKKWVSNEWKTLSGGDVEDKDMWELFLGEVERWNDENVRVRLLSIPRNVNAHARLAAEEAARTQQNKEMFDDAVLDPSLSAKSELQRFNIILALGGNDLSSRVWQSTLLPMAQMRSAETPEQALELLRDSPPQGIFIADAVITRHREVLERIIDAMHMGAKVVVGGGFASTATPLELARFFTILGLPWERGTHLEANVSLQSGVLDSHLTVGLPRELTDKMCFVKGVNKSECWYTNSGAEDQTAVAYTAIRNGRFGYIGCVSHERGAINIARAMLGQPL